MNKSYSYSSSEAQTEAASKDREGKRFYCNKRPVVRPLYSTMLPT